MLLLIQKHIKIRSHKGSQLSQCWMSGKQCRSRLFCVFAISSDLFVPILRVNTVTSIGLYIFQMLDEYEHVPEITAMVDQFDWYILPVTNPDGYVYTWEQVFLFSSLSCKVT